MANKLLTEILGGELLQSIEALAEQILRQAIYLGASDVHIIPRHDKPLIQLRVDNRLIPYYWLNKSQSERIISHFKFLACMDIGEKRRPQSGSMSFAVKEEIVGLRLSSLPALGYETLVIRIIPQKQILPIEKLSLFPSKATEIRSLLENAHGLIIFCGPTGSGKSTTLYSLLQYAKEFIHRHIITLEDPVETVTEDILQVQINEKAGMSYSVGLKAALRHDPDIIMLGEIRDKETAQIAVRAALTGHLILTTMHTRDAVGAIHRLVEFGVSFTEIRQTLLGIVAQRLVELKCPICTPVCSPYCTFSKRSKRASVYELLHGQQLEEVLEAGMKGERNAQSFVLLKDEIKKAVALGYIREEEYHKWVIK